MKTKRKHYTYKVQWNDYGMMVDRSDGAACFFRKRRTPEELLAMSDEEIIEKLIPSQGYTKFKKWR